MVLSASLHERADDRRVSQRISARYDDGDAPPRHHAGVHEQHLATPLGDGTLDVPSKPNVHVVRNGRGEHGDGVAGDRILGVAGPPRWRHRRDDVVDRNVGEAVNGTNSGGNVRRRRSQCQSPVELSTRSRKLWQHRTRLSPDADSVTRLSGADPTVRLYVHN